ncbi:MAG: NAD(P)-dependent oxidoreductase [Candidatus Obscuribacterales bacterium]|nr:NAD(P)-dependent oxidoreductase [Candidatus Obscuribacterales bacterium]
MKTEKVAFLGMGIMGSAMAVNLLQGTPLSVWNRSPGKAAAAVEAGAIEATSLAEAVGGADVVFSCLGDERDVESVLIGKDGVLDNLDAGSIIVDFSTIGPESAGKIAAACRERRCHFLDAPVTGGDVGARNGTLTILVGGEESIFERVKPLLQYMGKTLFYCGGSGAGQTLKLANQVLCSVNLVAIVEAMKLAEGLGLSPRLVVEALGNGAGGSWALNNLGPRILAEDFKPAFSIRHMLKDLRLASECAGESLNQLGGTVWAIERFKQVVQLEGEEGLDLGTQAMYKAYPKLGQ